MLNPNRSGKEVEQLSKVVDAYTADRMLGDLEDVTNVGPPLIPNMHKTDETYQKNYLDYRHELTLLESSATALKAEIDTISEALAGMTYRPSSSRIVC